MSNLSKFLFFKLLKNILNKANRFVLYSLLNKKVKSCGKIISKLSPKHKLPENLYQYQALPIIPLFQYASRVAIMLSGRLINRWWRRLPESEKIKLYNKVKRNGKVIGGVGVFLVGSEIIYYYYHLEVCAYTGRKRFMVLSNDELTEVLGKTINQKIFSQAQMLSVNHPYYKSIKSIIDILIKKNKDHYPGLSREWKLIICEDNSIVNAACLPTGEVIVYTGLINFVENPHQLATVLAHELAHVVLEHGRETVSQSIITSLMVSVFGFLLWTVVPGDIMAFFSNCLKNFIIQVFLQLPYNRMLESEADVLGLELMARSCFNFKEAKRFWELMNVFEKRSGMPEYNWLSTHPISILRAQHLESLAPFAQKVSKESGCLSETWWSKNIRRYNYLKA